MVKRLCIVLSVLARPEMVALLLRHNANPNHRDRRGFSPLIWTVLSTEFTEPGRQSLPIAAQEKRITSIIECLIAGQATHQSDNKGETPLHHAASQGYVFLLPILFKSKPIIDVENQDRETPLHLAAKHGHLKVVELLLEAGANREVRNHQELTAYQLAQQTEQDMSVQMALLVRTEFLVGQPVQMTNPKLEILKKLFNSPETYLDAKQAYETELLIIHTWGIETLAQLLQLVPILSEHACLRGEFLDAERHLKEASQKIAPKVPFIAQAHFYKSAGDVWLKYRGQEALPYYTSALNAIEEAPVDNGVLLADIQQSLNHLEVMARYGYAESLIESYSKKLQEQLQLDKKDMLAPFSYLEQLKPLLDYLQRKQPEALVRFYGYFETVINDYTLELLFAFEQKRDLHIIDTLRMTVSTLLHHQQFTLAGSLVQKVLKEKLPPERVTDWSQLAALTYQRESKSTAEARAPAEALRYRLQLKRYREILKAGLAANQPILQLQAEYAANLSALLNAIARTSAAWLGEPPCAYAWIGIGSLSTQALSPYSDVDCALLIAEEVYRTHPYFKAFILSINQIINGLGEPWDWSKDVSRGLHLDTGDLKHLLFSEQRALPVLLNTPEELAIWVIQTSLVPSTAVEALLAFSLLSPCLFYASSTVHPGVNLLSKYQQKLASGWELKTENDNAAAPTPLYRQAAIQFWEALLQPLLTARNMPDLDIKKQYLSPLNYLSTLVSLYYGFTNAEGRVQTKFPDILMQLNQHKHWHSDYLARLLEAWEYALRWRAAVQFKSHDNLAARQALADWEPLCRDVLYPWQAFAQASHNLSELPFGQHFHPLLNSVQDWLEANGADCFRSEAKVEIELLIIGLAAYLSRQKSGVEECLGYYARFPQNHRPLFYRTLQTYSLTPASLEAIRYYPDENGHRWAVDEERQQWTQGLNSLVSMEKPEVEISVLGPTIGRKYLKQAVISALLQSKWIIQDQNDINFNFFKKTDLTAALEVKAQTEAEQEAHRVKANAAQGVHLVVAIQHEGIRVHVKVRPDFPGMETAFSLLIRRIMGEGSPAVELWRWSSGTHHYPVLLSQTLPGEVLDETLLSQYPLEPKSYSQLALMSFLVNPGDGNPSNFLVQRHLNEQQKTVLRLVSIDNDRLFAPAFDAGNLRVASVLYCFDAMIQPVHPNVRAQLLCLNAHALLTAWLQDLKALNEQYLGFFKDDLAAYMDPKVMDKQQSYVVSMLKEQTLREVFIKLKTMQHWLIKKPRISHLALLSKLQPTLANYYSGIIQNPKGAKRLISPIARFEYAVGNEFRRETVGTLKKYTSSMHMTKFMQMQGRKITNKEGMITQWQQDFAKAQQELDDLSVSDSAIESAKKETLEGNFKGFEDLPTVYTRALVIARINFDKDIVTAEGNPDIIKQAQWWERLLRCSKLKNLEEIKISPCAGFTDKHFEALMQRMPNVKQIEIVGCVQLKKAFNSIYSKTLMRLKLVQLPLVEVVGINSPTLEYLNVSNNEGLKSLTLINMPNLTKLNASKAKMLTVLNITAPLLDEVDFSYCLKLSDAHLHTLINRCPEIKLMNLEGCAVEKISYKFIKELVPAIAGVNWPEKQLSSLAAIVEDILANELKELDVFEKFSGDKVFAGIAFKAIYLALLRNQSVTKINLSISFMGDEETCLLASMLEKNSNVKELWLFDKDIGDKGIIALGNALESNSSIELIILGPNIGDEGAIALGKALEKNHAIRMLGLVANNMGDKGAIGLARGLKHNKTLKALGLMGNNIGDRGAKAIAEALENSTIAAFGLLANGVADEGAKAFGLALARYQRINIFGLASNRIQDEGSAVLLEGLNKNPLLVGFGLVNCTIGTRAAAKLRDLLSERSRAECILHLVLEQNVPENLENWYGCSTPALVHTPEGIPSYFIFAVQTNQEDLVKIEKFAINRRTLYMIAEDAVTGYLKQKDKVVSPILVFTSEGLAKELILKEDKDDEIRVISSDEFEKSEQDGLNAFISKLKKEGVYLAGYGTTSYVIRYYDPVINILSKKVNMSFEEIDTKLLEELIVRNLEAKQIFLPFEHPVSKLIGKYHTVKLEDIGLIANSMDYSAVELLCDGLARNKTVQELMLAGNTIGTRRAETLAKMIGRNTSLKGLTLLGCNIGDKETGAFATALEGTTREKNIKINLLFNPINLNGFKALHKIVENMKFLSLQLLRPKGVDEELGYESRIDLQIKPEDRGFLTNVGTSFGAFCIRNVSFISRLLPVAAAMMSSSFVKFIMWIAREKFNYSAKSTMHTFLPNRYGFFSQNFDEQSELLAGSMPSNVSAASHDALDGLEADYKLAWQLQVEHYQQSLQSTLGNDVATVKPSRHNRRYQLRLPESAESCLADLVPTNPGGDCFFDAVQAAGIENFTRDILVAELLKHIEDINVRKVFALEIRQFLYLGLTACHASPTENVACQKLLTTEFRTLFSDLMLSEHQLQEGVKSARLVLGEERTRGLKPPELIKLLHEAKLEYEAILTEFYENVQGVDKALVTYCRKPLVLKAYIVEYLQNARGYIAFSRDFSSNKTTETTVDIINNLFGLNIQVYLEDTENRPHLKLVTRAAFGKAAPIYHNGINHFWGLETRAENSEVVSHTDVVASAVSGSVPLLQFPALELKTSQSGCLEWYLEAQASKPRESGFEANRPSVIFSQTGQSPFSAFVEIPHQARVLESKGETEEEYQMRVAMEASLESYRREKQPKSHHAGPISSQLHVTRCSNPAFTIPINISTSSSSAPAGIELLSQAIKDLNYAEVERVIQQMNVRSIRDIKTNFGLSLLEFVDASIDDVIEQEQMKACITKSVQANNPPVSIANLEFSPTLPAVTMWTPLANTPKKKNNDKAVSSGTNVAIDANNTFSGQTSVVSAEEKRPRVLRERPKPVFKANTGDGL
jgi:Ran GTPase-activating protein (RanGAP) involved in mRNA processing and transport